MDLKAHLLRQLAWSQATFGPGQKMDSIIDHIEKELVEVRESESNPYEWVDVVILALDGLMRSLSYNRRGFEEPQLVYHVARTACQLIENKQEINEAREWPDWRTAEPGKAIEHVKKL